MTALFVVLILIITNVWNPLPTLAGWWDRFSALSSPAPPWTTRLGGPPVRTAVMEGGELVAANDSAVTGYNVTTGAQLWTFKAFWGLPAQDVVVLRQQGTNPDNIGGPDTGYDVVNADTGKVIWGVRDAQAVWAYDDQIVDLVCQDSGCTLRGYSHFGGGEANWHVDLPAAAHVLHGPDPGLVTPRDPASWFDKAREGSPGRLPRAFALQIDDQVQVIDTLLHVAAKSYVPDLQTRVTVTNQTLLLSTATTDGDGCHFQVRGFNAFTGAVLFPSIDVDPGTADGVACSQHEDPVAPHGWLIARDPARNVPVLIDASTGDVRWTGVPSERVLATDGTLAAILTADRHTVQVIDLLIKPAQLVWSQKFGLDPQAAITDKNVYIRDGDNNRLYVFDHALASKGIDWHTQSVVIGFGDGYVVLASGLRIGPLGVPS
jgi:hypothetical protein